MKMRLVLGTVLGVGLALQGIAAAESHLEIDSETGSFQNRDLSLGPVQIKASYQPIDFEARPEATENNLQLQILRNGRPALSLTDTIYNYGSLDLKDLDNDGSPEIIVQAFTGGAHCCMAVTTYTWQDNTYKAVPFGLLDGGGGEFKDLNGDGLTEFLSFDNAFLYAFSSYAGSFPPSVILTFENGQYRDTTAQFHDYLKSTAWEMYQSLQERGDDAVDINGLLAGYVAQKIRLGEYQEGWNFMLAHYDKTTDWGLAEEYDQDGNVVSAYPDFPTALRGFLTDLGYLNSQGKPQPQVDRSPVDMDGGP
ncbi:MAG TPA: hypothetical protein V6D29_00875 [Leptolyngbyaceae cyanobacterium]